MSAIVPTVAAGVCRLLIVDDSPEDRATYRRFLAADPERQYDVQEASTGRAGLEAWASRPPDCVLLDYRLPDVDGIGFLAGAASLADAAPAAVVMLTGQGSEATAVAAMQAGAHDYLPKSGLSASALQRAVARGIERARLEAHLRARTDQLTEANRELQEEINRRARVEAALHETYAELERLVGVRTAELERVNRGLSREIAERKRIEEERQRLLDREQQANRLKDEFLATVSHELRTPLNAVLGWARVLRSAPVAATLHDRALASIERNAQAQARLIDDILEVSRIVSGKLRLRPKPMDLRAVVDAALDVVRPAADAKGIALERRIAQGAWPVVGDPDRLQQVAWNLLSNAVKFTPPGGRVTVELRRGTGGHELVVSDSGRGIEPGFLPHVFAPFRQADASTTREQGGLGLGLAIVKQLVELHGGAVEARSAGSGSGAQFVVTLPGREPDVAAGPATIARPTARHGDAADAVPDLAGLRALVVDDDPDARELLVTTLGSYGAEVTAAESAAEAMALLPEVRPDVLVSDIAMQGEDGYAFIRRVRGLPRSRGGRVPAIALTAYAADHDRARALDAGYQLHLAKPVDPIELARTVHRVAGEPWSEAG